MNRKLASINSEEKLGVIYRITNIMNGKKYIGKREQSKDVFLRTNYYGSGKYIKRALEKHGRENFKREIICEVECEKLCKLEKKSISEEKTRVPNGYNIQEGGEGGDNGIRKRTFTKEWKENISKSCKGKTAWNKGLSKKKDEKMKNTGRVFTEGEKKNISEKIKGIKRSEETKQKISNSMKKLYENGYVNYQHYRKRRRNVDGV